jgi:uncharacterized membrane protein YphA (DoxX/SURF4 family)
MKLNILLWILQLLLAALFAFAGGSKFVLPNEVLVGPLGLPVPFIRFIGVCEFAGALGLILPDLLRIRPGLTPLAAAGLVVIMAGATVLTAMGMNAAQAMVPSFVGLAAASVAIGRWRLRPVQGRTV